MSKTLFASSAVVTTVHTRVCAHSGNWKNGWVQQVRVQNSLLFTEARRLVEIATPNVVENTYAAVAAAPKTIDKSVPVNPELTWHLNDAKYKKVSDIEQTEICFKNATT